MKTSKAGLDRLGQVGCMLVRPEPLDYLFWGMLKVQVHSVKKGDTNHLKQHLTDNGPMEMLHERTVFTGILLGTLTYIFLMRISH